MCRLKKTRIIVVLVVLFWPSLLISVENTEQIAELEEASTQLAAELDEVLKTIEESRNKIGKYRRSSAFPAFVKVRCTIGRLLNQTIRCSDKYTSERAGQKSAVPATLKK